MDSGPTEQQPDTGGQIVDLGNDVFAIDTHMGGHSGITAGYLIRGERPCLVETGTALSAPVVRAALTRLGIDAHDLASVVVTHIHLDHAGGVGDLTRDYPNADVFVHERGAKHLADPARLMASARIVYGSVLDEFFGELLPTDASRVHAINDGDVIDLGRSRWLESHHSPGHAKHHVGLLDTSTGDLYVGDAAGVYIPQTGDMRPATPPPDFDLDAALASLRTFAGLRPDRLLFSHFGPVSAVQETLDRAAEELNLWVELVGQAREQDLDTEHTLAMINERTTDRYLTPHTDPQVAEAFDELADPRANITGIRAWLDHQAETA